MSSSDIIDQKYIYLGSFDIDNNKIVISDPSYEFDEKTYKHDTWKLNALISNAKKGKWQAWLYQHNYKKGGKRNAVLYAIHASIINENDTPDKIKNQKWEKIMDLGVDTGQIGIHDINHFRNDLDANNKKLAEYIKPDDMKDPGEKWYAMVCAVTYNDNPSNAGIIPYGVVSSSGWGDGIYELYSLTNENNVIGLKIIFIRDDQCGCYKEEFENGECKKCKIKMGGGSINYFKKYLKYKTKYLNLKLKNKNKFE